MNTFLILFIVVAVAPARQFWGARGHHTVAHHLDNQEFDDNTGEDNGKLHVMTMDIRPTPEPKSEDTVRTRDLRPEDLQTRNFIQHEATLQKS